VTHTAGPAFVSLQWDGDHPMLSVADSGPRCPALDQAEPLAELPADPLAEHGRGLFLVSRLALDVEVATGRHGGSQVSVTLDVARPA
jgi:anti-sigma regulatory factor (Ser/Thr protein kinase)